MSNVLVVSTYELGEQPLGCAVPAAALEDAGHDVRQLDLSVDSFPDGALSAVDALVVSVPMHTALRLGLEVVDRARAENPDIRVALHGLYAPVGARVGALSSGDIAIAGESTDALVAWANELSSAKKAQTDDQPATVLVELGRRPRHRAVPAPLPKRSGLPTLDRYARLLVGDSERLVGAVEATSGCNHRCRHCPVPVIYDGRSRPAELGDLRSDIEQLLAAGAKHIHFADPDFLNRPQHALRVASLVHEIDPELSFDATIKVSHLVAHQKLLPALVEAGLCFVVSAFESTSEVVLERLAKGHTVQQEEQAIAILRRLGVEIRPSLLPFTPWTTRDDLVELFDFVARNDLVDNIDCVQYGIRLLIPPGSLLLSDPDPVFSDALVGYDEAELGYAWKSADPLLDELARSLGKRAELAATLGESAVSSYAALRGMLFEALARDDPGQPVPTTFGVAAHLRPRLSESWFCCAEPTTSQVERMLGACVSVACESD